jgi:hypothetical protein
MLELRRAVSLLAAALADVAVSAIARFSQSNDFEALGKAGRARTY